MSPKEIIRTEKAPQAIGPYSQATRLGNLVFSAGQLGIDPGTGNIVEGGIEAETRQALVNIQHVLEQAGTTLSSVLKTTVFLRDMQDFSKMNAVYGLFFNDNPPARSTIQVAGLPKGGEVEIDVIAYIS